jgi:exonuclease VII small subunit
MTKFKYDKAVQRLDEISQELDGEINDITKVADLVKESAELITKCKKMLRSTTEEIDKTFNDIN